MPTSDLKSTASQQQRCKFWETTETKPKKFGLWDFISALLAGASRGLEKHARDVERRRPKNLVTAGGYVDDEESDSVITEDDLRKAKKELEEAEDELQRKKKEMLAVGVILGRYVH